MKLKKFRAENMAEAMHIIKEDIGPDAVIMSSRLVKKKKGLFGLFGKKEFEVVAGYEEKQPEPKNFANMLNRNNVRSVPRQDSFSVQSPVFKETPFVHDTALNASVNELKGMIDELNKRVSESQQIPTEKRYSKPVMDIYRNLTENGVEAETAEQLCSQTEGIAVSRNVDARDVARNLIIESIGEPKLIQPVKYQQKAYMFVGPTGVGKTTTLIKIAYMLVYQKHLNVGIINADSFRVAAKEHIQAYCDILKTDMITIYKPEEIKDALEAFKDKDIVLIDTAGKVSDDVEYRADIEKIKNLGHINDIYVVLSASTSDRVIGRTIDNYAYLRDFSIIVTKTDEIPMNGVFLYLAKRSGKKLSYMSVGQNVPDDLRVVNPVKIAESVLESQKV